MWLRWLAVHRRCLLTTAAEQVYPYHEPAVLTGHRRRLLLRARGRVVDLSHRWSPNQVCYRADAVTAVTVLRDPHAPAGPPGSGWADDPMAGRGSGWADDPMAGRIEIVGASLDEVELAASSCDTVVATMTLCTAADVHRTLASVAGWLRPGGQLLVLEHVRGTGLIGAAQQLAAPLEAAVGAGCRVDLDLSATLRTAGFAITDCARFTARIASSVPVPCLAGVAVRGEGDHRGR